MSDVNNVQKQARLFQIFFFCVLRFVSKKERERNENTQYTALPAPRLDCVHNQATSLG